MNRHHTIPVLRPVLWAGLAASALCAAQPALAHHAFAAEFDAAQPIEVKGSVTKLALVNPHSWLYVDVRDSSGNTVNWGFEFAAPFSLQQRGLSKADLPVGSEVLLKGFRAKSGKEFAYAVTARLPDGRTVSVGGAQNVPGADAQ
jgi:hypothetical protein